MYQSFNLTVYAGNRPSMWTELQDCLQMADDVPGMFFSLKIYTCWKISGL